MNYRNLYFVYDFGANPCQYSIVGKRKACRLAKSLTEKTGRPTKVYACGDDIDPPYVLYEKDMRGRVRRSISSGRKTRP